MQDGGQSPKDNWFSVNDIKLTVVLLEPLYSHVSYQSIKVLSSSTVSSWYSRLISGCSVSESQFTATEDMSLFSQNKPEI
jgi:hypothetical protein